jgi:hypothetical protein
MIQPGSDTRSDALNDAGVWYFAYGSNMDPAQLKARCSDKGVAILDRIAGSLPGWRLAFNKQRLRRPGEAAANVMEDSTGVVEGTLNRMLPAGLDLLDVDEGVSIGQYRRRAVRVTRRDTGMPVDAIMYVALPTVVATGLRPSRSYLDRLLAGRDLLTPAYHDMLAAVPVLD